MNICIVGAGNIGTYLATYISMKEGNKVWLHTSKPEVFKEEITLVEEEKNLRHNVKVHSITSSYEEAVKKCDLCINNISIFYDRRNTKKNNSIFKERNCSWSYPGFGGKEYLTDELLEKGCIFFRSQRVPSIIRLEKYGECVLLKQKNEFMKLRVIPSKYSDKVCEVMTNFIDIPCLALSNYLAITLSPSNPTMHPSRLYELFNDYVEGEKVYQEIHIFMKSGFFTFSNIIRFR